MEIDLTLLFGGIGAYISNFLEHSFLFAALKFFLFVYTAVLLVDVILLLYFHGFTGDLKQALYGASNRPLLTKGSFVKRWEGILSRLQSKNPSQYKVVILEADALADEMLAQMGYGGENMAEKLKEVWGGHLESRDLLAEAHEIRNRIVHEQDFTLSREDAEHWLENYKKYFEELELF